MSPGSLAWLCLLGSSIHRQKVTGWPHETTLEPRAVWPVGRQVGSKVGRGRLTPACVLLEVLKAAGRTSGLNRTVVVLKEASKFFHTPCHDRVEPQALPFDVGWLS